MRYLKIMRAVKTRSLWASSVVLFVLSASCSSLGFLVAADSVASPWLTSQNPTLHKDIDLTSSDPLPTTAAGLGNRDCDDATVTTRPARTLQTPLTTASCFIKTAYGVADSNGLIRFGDASVAGQSVNSGAYLPGLVAIPSSFDVINYTSAGSSGLYLHFSRSLPSPMSTTVALNGQVTYQFNGPATASLRDKSGGLLPAQTDSLSFSSNGKWMVVDSPNRAMLRVNVETLEALPFANPFNYTIGLTPSAQTAVSNDGRYVAVASKNFSVFRLYDTATCGPVPVAITTPVACQSRDLLPFMQSQLPGYFGVFNVRFVTSTVLSLYGANSPSGTIKRAKYSLLAPGETLTHVAYMALGDSFASGEGENSGKTYYEPGTDTNFNKCHLSTRSYPYLLKSDLVTSDFHSIACSGARIENLISTNESGAQNPKDTPLSKWTPGYQRQLDYLAGVGPPTFLTVSVGGNDVGFSDVLIECVTSHYVVPIPNTCKYAANQTERGNLAKRIADQYAQLVETYKQIIRATNSQTKIYVVGYPQFIKDSGGSCGINVHLNDAERLLIATSTHYMDQVVKAAADAAGAYYLDAEDALLGKNLCSLVSDQDMGVNGVTEGDDKRLPWWAGIVVDKAARIVGLDALGIGNESFHPNDKGQRLIHDKIMQLTGGDPASFAICSGSGLVVCPHAGVQVPLPDAAYFGADATGYVSSLNNLSAQTQTRPSTPRTIIGTIAPGQANIQVDSLLPSSTATLSLMSISGPIVSLGSAPISTGGILSSTLAIPSGTPTGFQSLHIVATDMGGTLRDYYQLIYIPGTSGDINGNGIADVKEGCGFIAESGFDRDVDGIDDACDGEIGQLPQSVDNVYRYRVGDVIKGENPQLTYLERNVAVGSGVFGLVDSDIDSDGWVAVGSTDNLNIQSLFFIDGLGQFLSSEAALSPTYLSTLSFSQRRSLQPVFVAWDSSTSTCFGLLPNISAPADPNNTVARQTNLPVLVPCSAPRLPAATFTVRELRIQ